MHQVMPTYVFMPMLSIVRLEMYRTLWYVTVPVEKYIALKCKTPRRKMQVALLAEPKTPLESSVFVYEHYVGAGITQCTAYTEFQALPVTHACIIVYRARVQS